MLGGKNKLDNVFRVNAVLPPQHPFPVLHWSFRADRDKQGQTAGLCPFLQRIGCRNLSFLQPVFLLRAEVWSKTGF